MARIQPIEKEAAGAATTDLLGMVKRKMGSVPNIISTMANSLAVAKAYLGFNQALSAGALSLRMREQIALLVGELNNCEYCLAAHTAFGKGVGLDDQEIADARQASARSDRERAALVFVRSIVQNHGSVSDIDVAQVRNAGFTDGEIIEIIANVALNIFTNYFNLVVATEVDFPTASDLAAA